MDDFPFRLANSVDDEGLLPIKISQPVNASELAYLFEWAVSRLYLASARNLGPAWVEGFAVSWEGPFSINIDPGIAYPTVTYPGFAVAYSRRVQLGATRITDAAGANLLLQANIPYLVAVQCDDSVPEGGSVQIFPLEQNPVDSLHPSETGTFYYAPATQDFESVVPLAFVLLDEDGSPIQLVDVRMRDDSYAVARLEGPWLLSERAWEASSGSSDVQGDLIGHLNGVSNSVKSNEWTLIPNWQFSFNQLPIWQQAFVADVDLRSLRSTYPPPYNLWGVAVDESVFGRDLGLEVMVFCPAGYDIEIEFTCQARGMNTLRVTPWLNGATPLESEIKFESAPNQIAQVHDEPNGAVNRDSHNGRRLLTLMATMTPPAAGLHRVSVALQSRGFLEGFPVPGQTTAFAIYPENQVSAAQLRVRRVRSIRSDS